MRINKLLIGICTGIILATNVFAAPQVKLNGQAVKLVQQAFEVNGRTFIPLRVISENLGAKVNWNPALKEISINQSYNLITLRVNEKTARVNNKIVSLDAAAQIKDSVTFVPLRFVSEALGVDVDYDSKLAVINLTTSDAAEMPIVEPSEELKEEIKEEAGTAEPVSIDQFGNAFKGRLGDANQNKVIIAKRSDLPIQIGSLVIHDIYLDERIIVTKQSWVGGDWDAGRLYFSDKDGINRSRDAYEQIKDTNGIIKSKHAITASKDQLFDPSGYKTYDLNKVNYFVFKDDGNTILAITKDEVVK